MSPSPEIAQRGRRQFLRGVGGTLLAIPFLPSLMPRSARAQSAARPKFFVGLQTANGGAWFEHMFPSDSMLTESASYAGRTVRRGDLVATDSGGQASLSPVLTAADTSLTAELIGKMNVVAGFDMPYALGHHSGGHLGNYAANNDPTYGKTKGIPTIDQIMAYSSSFYGDLSTILRRSVHLGFSGYPVSYYWSNPGNRTGTVQPINGTGDSLAAFKQIFVALGAPVPGSTRALVVDRVYESYQRLRQSNRRISTDDARRLDEHMARVAEIQRRARVMVSCDVTPPTQSSSGYWTYPGPSGITPSIPAYQLLNDVIVAAFLCGTCRIATLSTGNNNSMFSNYVGDWHGLVHTASQASQAAAVDAEGQVYGAWQGFFENVFVDLIKKLDTDDGTGTSLLDSALVTWTQECSAITHEAFSLPIVMAGSAGGTLRTGSYIDYRNLDVSRPYPGVTGQVLNPGLVWNQWLGTQLQAMGVPRSEYEIPSLQPSRPGGAGTGGYGWFDDAIKPFSQQQVGDYDSAFPVLGEIPLFLGA